MHDSYVLSSRVRSKISVFGVSGDAGVFLTVDTRHCFTVHCTKKKHRTHILGAAEPRIGFSI